MTGWYVKDLSRLAKISVQTLYYYDRIDLLTPSLRLPNGYRRYCEKDLLRLQQIMALKCFGLSLPEIKELLKTNIGSKRQFELQARALEEKAMKLMDASHALRIFISEVNDNEPTPWETLIKLMEVYRMTEKLTQKWVKEILTSDELQQYIAFETEWKKNPQQKAEFDKEWADLIAEITENLKNDPASEKGIAMGEKTMQWINGVYGKKYAALRTKIFEKGFEKGKGLKELGLTSQVVSWMEQSLDAYWKNHFLMILKQVGSGVPDDVLFNLWREALEDLCGEDDVCKKEVYDRVFSDKNVPENVKEWLKTLQQWVAANRYL